MKYTFLSDKVRREQRPCLHGTTTTVHQWIADLRYLTYLLRNGGVITYLPRVVSPFVIAR
jgi:hypothetical protein